MLDININNTYNANMDLKKMNGRIQFSNYGKFGVGTPLDKVMAEHVAKDGVRSHSWLSSLILRLFDKVVRVHDGQGRSFYLNTNSLLNRVVFIKNSDRPFTETTFRADPVRFIRTHLGFKREKEDLPTRCDKSATQMSRSTTK